VSFKDNPVNSEKNRRGHKRIFSKSLGAGGGSGSDGGRRYERADVEGLRDAV
jgi:hypothetical protein